MIDKKSNRYVENKQIKIATGYIEIHVFVQQSSALCLNKNQVIEAMISVQAFGKIQYSKVQSKIGFQPKTWGEHFYFNKTFKKQEAEALQKSLIVIKAWDHKKILSSALIGEHQLSVAKIYSMKDHLLENTWLALSNVTKNYGQVSGMIKISINVTHENDQSQTLKLQGFNASQKEKSILMAANVSRKSHQLTVNIYEGNDLKPVAGDTTDAYIGLQFGMIYQRTKTKVNECNPAWNETLQIPIHYPAYVDNVIIRLIDANVFKSKEVMGSCYISLLQLKSQEQGRSLLANDKKREKRLDEGLWVNFYGPQIQGENNQYKHKYSIYPDLAPYYCGSVLMKAILQPNSHPKKAHDQIEGQKDEVYFDQQTGQQKKIVKPPKPYIQYKVHVKFELGMNLPTKFSSYAMSVRVGRFEQTSRMKKVKHGFVMWNNEKEFIVRFYENQNVPDIFFYLINEDEEKICFYRTPVKFNRETKQFQLQNTWKKLKPDQTKIKIYSEEAGYVKFQLTITQVTDKKKQKKTLKNVMAEHNDKQFSQNQGTFYSEIYMSVPCKILIDLYCAENLLAGDDDGSADPYFKFSFQDSDKVSSVKNSTINPVYIQRMILEGKMGDKNQIMPLTVTVFNKNPITDQAIGTCYINLKQQLVKERIFLNSNYNCVPQWYEIEIDGNTYGKFLAGITIIRGNKIRPMNAIAFLEDDLQTFQINLMILGLRGLKSSNSIISIRKPVIRFDFQSLYVYSSRQLRRDGTLPQQNQLDKQQQKQRQKLLDQGISSNSPGSTVNIQLSERVKMKLPKNTQFWPKLWARVNNSVIGDLFQPHIGYFYIDLRNAYMRTKKLQQQYNKQKDEMKKLNKPFQISQKLKDVSETLLSSLLIFFVKNIKYNWHEMNEDIKGKLNRLKIKQQNNLFVLNKKQQDKIKKLNQNYIVIIPSYQYIEDEDIYKENFREIFDENGQYIKVGYDSKRTLRKTKQHRNRHYRYCLDKPFEKYYQEVNGIQYGVYSQIPIKKGRVFLPDQKNLVNNNALWANQQRDVGFYKGNCLILQKNEIQKEQDQQFFQQKEQQLKSFLKKQSIRMYLYVLNAFGIPKKKGESPPRPYLVVKFSQSDEKNYSQKNDQQSSDPEFNIAVQKDLDFPQNSQITLQIWDRGFLNVPELIGEAVIYAQNRVFYQFGKMKFNNPAQTHPLKVMQSRQQQGRIRFWVDFVPIDCINLYKEHNITSSASNQFQVRVIIWGCSDISSSQNDITDMVDLQVTCAFNGKQQQTDIHYRTESGEGSFNWRMIFPVKLPLMDYSLTFKVYDKGLIGKNSCLASGQKNIGNELQKAYQNQMAVKLYEGEVDMKSQAGLPCQVKKDKSGTLYRYDIFNINLTSKSQGSQLGLVNAAKVMVSIQILPKVQAQKKKSGAGRKDPNQYPNLPQPSGRMQFSLNPVTMLTRLCGKRFKNKIIITIVCFLFGTCIIYFFPSIFGSLVAKALKS